MKKYLLLLLVIPLISYAAWDRRFRNLKLPNQDLLETQIMTPVASSTNDILSAATGDTNGTGKTYTSFLAQPDMPRNLVITPGGSTADVAAGNVVVTGKDLYGHTISENFAFLANASTATTGAKAFASITSIVFPAEDSPYNATWSVGRGSVLGLSHCIDGTGFFIKGLDTGAALSGATVTADSSVISGNTVLPNPTPNGTKKFTLFFVQNYKCP